MRLSKKGKSDPGHIAQMRNDRRYNLFEAVLGAGFRGIMPQTTSAPVLLLGVGFVVRTLRLASA